MKDLEQRLNELEIRSTHQERLIEELNDVILDNSRQITALSREIRMLRGMMQSLEPESIPSPDE